MRNFVRALILALPLFIANSVFAQVEGQVCDVDIDGDVDINDVRLITAARNTPSNGPDDPRDADGDGIITVADARTCMQFCTLPRCAEPQPNRPSRSVAAPIPTGSTTSRRRELRSRARPEHRSRSPSFPTFNDRSARGSVRPSSRWKRPTAIR